MADDDFVNIDPITPFSIETVKGISKFQWLQFKGDQPFKLYYSELVNEETVPLREMNIATKPKGKEEHVVSFENIALPRLGTNRQKTVSSSISTRTY